MPREPTSRQRPGAPAAFWVSLVLLAAATLAMWAPGRGSFFALDDFVFLEAYAPGSPLASPARWLTDVSPVDNAYRPLTTAAYFTIARKAFGLDPRGYHTLSLALHCATALLVALFCWTMVRSVPAAVLGGLFYASRSSLWVAVRWVSGTQELGLALGAALAAAALAAYMRRGRPWALAACLGGVLVALASKEGGVVLALALLPVAIAAPSKRWAKRAASSLGPAFAVTGLYLAWRVSLTWSHPTIHQTTTSPSHLAQRLLKYLVWSFSGAPADSAPALAVSVAGLAFLGLMLLAGRSPSSTAPGERPPAWPRAISAGIAFFGLALIPPLVITQVPHQYYLSMPLVGMSLAVAGAAGGILWWAEARSRALTAALTALLVAGVLVPAFVEARAKDAGRIPSGGFYKAGDGAVYETAWRGASGLWPSLPEGASLLMVGYPYDGLISSDLGGGGGLKPTSTMASMFRAFYGREDLAFAHVVDEPSQAGTVGPSEALRTLAEKPDKAFVALHREGRFEALSGAEARDLFKERLKKTRAP